MENRCEKNIIQVVSLITCQTDYRLHKNLHIDDDDLIIIKTI